MVFGLYIIGLETSAVRSKNCILSRGRRRKINLEIHNKPLMSVVCVKHLGLRLVRSILWQKHNKEEMLKVLAGRTWGIHNVQFTNNL